MKISFSFNPSAYGEAKDRSAEARQPAVLWVIAGLALALIAATAALGLRSLPMTMDLVRLLVFPALMAYAASSDLFTMTISNRVSLALIAGFAVLALATGMPLATIGWHGLAALAVLVVCFGFFSQGWIGGGDAKLAAATALWLGFDHLLDYLVYASIFGGVLTLLLLQFRTWPLPARLHGLPWLARLHEKNAGVPYGIALAAAAMMVYPHTAWMQIGALLPS